MTDDPMITPMMEGSIAVHETFINYVKAGFSEDQAMQLLIAHIMASG
jgi:hypothetical protein